MQHVYFIAIEFNLYCALERSNNVYARGQTDIQMCSLQYFATVPAGEVTCNCMQLSKPTRHSVHLQQLVVNKCYNLNELRETSAEISDWVGRVVMKI